MKITDLQFSYPESLVATEPVRPSRVLKVELGHLNEKSNDGSSPFQEISIQNLIDLIPAGDVLVINETQVLKRRIYTNQDLEILFLSHSTPQQNTWEVLFPSKKYQIGEVINLPDFNNQKYSMTLIKKGRPQIVQTNLPLTEEYFQACAELPLPPYIQKARGQRHTVDADQNWYQTAWAEKPGSLAAPTASLHFSAEDIEKLQNKGVLVQKLVLHVGLGTFLPVTSEDLDQHDMHEEYVEIPWPTWRQVQSAKVLGKGVWSLGTTCTRALESAAHGLLAEGPEGMKGMTKLLIQPGFDWKVVNRLLTNFHQPESTLLALVSAFADLNTVKSAYQYAIDRRFRLFSYGDLSVWIR